MITLTIDYKGQELEVTGTYYEGERRSYDSPGEPSSFHIEQIEWNGNNVTDLMNSICFDIEEKCLEKMED